MTFNESGESEIIFIRLLEEMKKGQKRWRRISLRTNNADNLKIDSEEEIWWARAP